MRPTSDFPDGGDDAVAIIGMACRFPGDGSTPEGFWNMVKAARTAHSPIPKSRFNADAWYHPDPERKGAIGVKSGFFLDEDLGVFDAPFFSMTASEANTMDPMHRWMLEVAYEGFENAGIPMSSVTGSDTGCFVGCFTQDYGLMSGADIYNTGPYMATGIGATMLSNRVSWFFDLHGPSMSIDTACSSSMYALHLACQSIKSGEIKQAIVGGTNLLLYPDIFHSLSKMHMMSPDGRCHSFDSRANGYARGEAIGVLIVKSLKDAIADGDTVRAVIRNTGCNQDGRTPGITMPSAQAQADLIAKTYAKVGLPLSDTAYFEAHGTGTPLGDPLELSALGSTFGAARSPEQPPLYVSSVKTNIGHTEGCSALAGIIKAVMSIEEGVIAPNAEFETLNPKLRLEEWRLALPPHTIPWPKPGVRRVSVNSFGYGGANGHVILDDAVSFFDTHHLNGKHTTKLLPELVRSSDDSGYNSGAGSEVEAVNNDLPPRLFVLSTHDQAGIQRLGTTLEGHMSRKLTDSVTQKEAEDCRSAIQQRDYLQQLAFTLSERRSVFDNRSYVVASTLGELQAQLHNDLPKARRATKNDNLFMIFTGQGAHWQRMGAELLTYPAFSKSLDSSQEYLRSLGCPWDLIEELLRREDSCLHEPQLSQPICTAIQVALVDLLSHWGVRAKTVVGHSSGEIGAAYAARIISHETAVKVAYFRGVYSALVDERLGNMTTGTMMAAGVSEVEAEPYIARLTSGRAVIACINSPLSVTLSGDSQAISELQSMLTADGKFARALKVTTAYHSHHMMTIADDYFSSMGELETLLPPKDAPVMFSSVTGSRIQANEIDAAYWVKNMTSPVNFSQAVRSLLSHCETNKRRKTVIKYGGAIEVGPHAALQGPLKQILAGVDDRLNNTILYASVLSRGKKADISALSCIGSMWAQGLTVDLARVNSLDLTQPYCKTLSDLPAYPWNHTKTFWHEPPMAKSKRFKKAPRDDLLGMAIDCQNALHPRWRQFLSIREQPWLEHHIITNTVLFPGAGMLIMALEAARQTADTTRRVKGFNVRDVSFDRGLVIPRDPEQAVETSLEFQPHKLDNKVVKDWTRFTLFSLSPEDDKNWIEHCSGLISIAYEELDDADASVEDHQQWLDNTETFHQIRTTSQQAIDHYAFYKNLTKIGMGYGQLFQNLTDAYGGPGCGHGRITIPDTRATMPFEYEYPHLIHPATLDAIFHLLFVGLESGADMADAAVPISMGSMFVAAELPQGAGSVYRAYTTGRMTTTREGSGSIVVSDDQWSSPKIIIQDFVACKVSGTGPEIDLGLEQLCTQLEWIRDIELEREIADKDELLTVASPELQLLAWLDQFCRKRSDLNVLVVQSEDDPLYNDILQLFAPLVGARGRFDRCTFVSNSEEVMSEAQKMSRAEGWTCDWNTASPMEFVEQRKSDQSSFDLIIATHLHRPDLLATVPILRPRGWMVLNNLVSLPDDASVVTRHRLTRPLCQDSGVILATHAADYDDALPQQVVLLEPEVQTTALEALRSSLTAALAARSVEVSSLTLEDTGSLHGKTIISLLEVERAFTKDIDARHFENFRNLCTSNPYMLWISGSLLPFSPSTGLLRVVRTEIPQIRLPHLSVSPELLFDSSHCSNCIMDVLMATRSEQIEQVDMEYQEIGGRILIPRLTAYESFDSEIDISRPSPKLVRSTLERESRALKLIAGTLGSLASLQWVDDEVHAQALGDADVELKVVRIPIHRSDAHNAMGNTLSRSMGHEAQGIVTRVGKDVKDLTPGQRVVALYQDSCRTMIRQHRSFVVGVPSSCGSDVPPAIPLINALCAISIAEIRQSDDVLVHMAASAIGQFVVQAIQKMGAKLFITVEKPDQKRLMCQKYGIPSSRVLSLSGMRFVKSVQRLTQGRGVDVVVNTLADETFPHTWSCVAEGGRFIDLTESANKVMIDTSKQISYHKIDIGRATSDRTPHTAKLLSKAYQLVECGTIDGDLDTEVFEIGNAAKAFERARSDNSEGSVVLELDDHSHIPVAPSRPANLELNPAATYLVPGGLGGLGPGIISMMIESGAKHVVTISRSGARTQKQKDYVQQWRDRGCAVDALCCDCTDTNQLSEFVSYAQERGWNIKGVVQLAMVLSDAPFETMTFEQWQKATRPKIEGTWNLHEYLPKDLDFFIALSSISNTIGNAGQANYCAGNAYQEALCHYRTTLGLKGTSINVGLMSDTEEYGTNEDWQDFLQNNPHFRPLQVMEADFLVVLKACMKGTTSDAISIKPNIITGMRNDIIRNRDGQSQTAIWACDRKFDLRVMPSCERPATTMDRTQDRLSTAALLGSATSLRNASAICEGAVRRHIASAMTADPEDIDPDKPLHAYGVDSLKAVEVRNWIFKDAKSEISVFDILSQMSISKLSEKIATNSKLVKRELLEIM